MAGIGECCVCTDLLENNLATVPCGHVFHFECVKKCIENFEKCPKCRKSCKLADVIKIFSENLSSNDGHDMNTEFKALFKKINKIAESNSQNLQRVLKMLEEKEKEIEQLKNQVSILSTQNDDLKKELEDERVLREAAEHVLILELSKNTAHEQENKITMSNQTPVQPMPSKPIISSPTTIPLKVHAVKKVLAPKQNETESSFPVIITHIGGSCIVIEMNGVIIVFYPTISLLKKLKNFKKMDICIGASPDKKLIIELMERFPLLIFLTSEKQLLNLFKSDLYAARIHFLEYDKRGYKHTDANISPIDFIPSIGWIIKSSYINIYLYTFEIETMHLKKILSQYGELDLIITKTSTMCRDLVENHFLSGCLKTIIFGGINTVYKEEVMRAGRKFSIDDDSFAFIEEGDEFVFQNTQSRPRQKQVMSNHTPTAPPEEMYYAINY